VQVPALAPFLDLSLVQSVTYVIEDAEKVFAPTRVALNTHSIPDPSSKDFFVPHRLLLAGQIGPTFSPLEIESLTVKADSSYSTKIWLFFDPRVARFQGRPVLDPEIDEVSTFEEPPWFRWTRLREITCVDATTENRFFEHNIHTGPVVLTWDLSVADKQSALVGDVVEDLSFVPDESSFHVGKVIVMVRTEAIRGHLLQKLAGCALINRTTVLVKPA
jgi:hypothetical protein